ncbi:hypothetical protein P3S67_022559 [Capsicum chacoense]
MASKLFSFLLLLVLICTFGRKVQGDVGVCCYPCEVDKDCKRLCADDTTYHCFHNVCSVCPSFGRSHPGLAAAYDKHAHN